MNPVRPTSVSPNAVCIYPGQMFGPGLGVQPATLTAIEAQINRLNANATLRYLQALSDYQINDSIDKALGLPEPPRPTNPQIKVTVTYADAQGDVTTNGADGLHYAWVEETLVNV